MKHLLLTLSTILLIINLSNAQLIWDGGAGTNKWNDKANWDGDALPTATTNVLIDGPYNVELDADGFCASVELKGTSTLTIGGIATLKIEDFSPDGFHIRVNNKAALTNTGFIDITNKISNTIINDGIFNNLALIQIEESAVAIRNESNGTFINDGDIKLFITGIGIMNEGSFRNDDVILIDSVLSGTNGYGINNFSEFINNNSGHITVMRTSVDAPGISIAASGTLTNGGIITIDKAVHGIIVFGNLVNNDSISIKETDIYPMVNNGGMITNTLSGSIAISKNTESNSHGIWNWANSTIDNDGIITVDSITGNGLLNEGICNVNGTLTIQNCDDELIKNGNTLNVSSTGLLLLSNTLNALNGIGLTNADTGLVLNSGKIQTNNIDKYGVVNFGLITNDDSILIDNSSEAGLLNSGRIINNACFKVTNTTVIADIGALYNIGFLHNIGIIEILQVNGAAGLDNRDSLFNDGTIIIRENSNELIENAAEGYIDNNGFIEASNARNGIDNQGTIKNKNRIGLDSLLGSAILNNSDIFNEIGAIVNIRTADIGISNNSAGAKFFNDGRLDISDTGNGISDSGEFTNSHIINIDSFSFSGLYCRGGAFTNAEDAMLNITDGNSGIVGHGSLTNMGGINIAITSDIGIHLYNNGNFDQHSTGTLLLQNISGDYLIANTGAEISILGEVTFD